jgi:type IV secretory pathway protease TraF
MPQGTGTERNVGDVLLSSVVAVKGDVEAGLRAAGQVLAMQGRVVPAVRPEAQAGPPGPSHEAVRAVVDCDLLMFVQDTPGIVERLVFGHAPLARAVGLSRGARVCLLPTKAALEGRGSSAEAYLDASSEALGVEAVQFALADSTPEDRVGFPLQAERKIDGVRVIELPLADPDHPMTYDALRLADAVLSFCQYLALYHHRHWRV